MHTCNPSAQAAEAGGSQIGGQPGLHTVFLTQDETKPRAKWYILRGVGIAPNERCADGISILHRLTPTPQS